MRIYLVGFMGAGKTSLGRQAAQELMAHFIDTDERIEEMTSQSILTIFEKEGEESFRNTEAKILRETLNFDHALIATGGGLPVYHHNMDWMLEHGITMYLEWPEEILLASLIQHRSVRPILANIAEEEAVQKAIRLLGERKPIYELSAITLTMTGEFEEDAKTLIKACKYIW
ncbi:MAG: shikimate kinase [Bacteroidota bacterium]|nr:shikimate kinase [Bacteroidota bacterium]